MSTCLDSKKNTIDSGNNNCNISSSREQIGIETTFAPKSLRSLSTDLLLKVCAFLWIDSFQGKFKFPI